MRILVVDDHPLLREILSAVLRKTLEKADVSAESDLEKAFATLARTGPPDIAVLDLGLPGCDGVDAVTRFHRKFAEVPIVVVSTIEDPQTIRAAFDAGAAGYIPKTSALDVMTAAFKLIAAGGTYVPPQAVVPSTLPRKRLPATQRLTDRQREVLRLLLKGYNTERIAADLSIAEGTVKQHTHAIYAALGVASRVELIAATARATKR